MKKIILVAMVILSFAACTETKAPEVEIVVADTAVVAPVTETVVPVDTAAVATATK